MSASEDPETAILNRQVATLVEDNTRLNEHVRSLQRTVTRKAAEARAAEVRADAAERSMRDMRRELDRVAERLRQPERGQL